MQNIGGDRNLDKQGDDRPWWYQVGLDTLTIIVILAINSHDNSQWDRWMAQALRLSWEVFVRDEVHWGPVSHSATESAVMSLPDYVLPWIRDNPHEPSVPADVMSNAQVR